MHKRQIVHVFIADNFSVMVKGGSIIVIKGISYYCSVILLL